VARIRETITVPLSRERAFDHIADFTTTAAWDPGIAAAERLDEGELGLGSRFRVQLALGPFSLPLVYEITRYEPSRRVVLTTSSPLHLGEDDVRFVRSDGGTLVEWNALFRLRGPGRLLDPLLGQGFRQVAKEAVAGLETSLRELASQVDG
jgi:hypothetical protein